jgi:hypothetical protein
MNRWINTKQDEGWLALCICILANVTTEQAFRLVVNPEMTGIRRKWTAEDLENIEAYRKEGLSWAAIGNIYNKPGPSLNRLYNRYRKEKRCER